MMHVRKGEEEKWAKYMARSYSTGLDIMK
jgi:hypothetical protein